MEDRRAYPRPVPQSSSSLSFSSSLFPSLFFLFLFSFSLFLFPSFLFLLRTVPSFLAALHSTPSPCRDCSLPCVPLPPGPTPLAHACPPPAGSPNTTPRPGLLAHSPKPPYHACTWLPEPARACTHAQSTRVFLPQPRRAPTRCAHHDAAWPTLAPWPHQLAPRHARPQVPCRARRFPLVALWRKPPLPASAHTTWLPDPCRAWPQQATFRRVPPRLGHTVLHATPGLASSATAPSPP